VKKIFLAGAVVTASLSGTALAADLPAPAYKSPPQAYTAAISWTGCFAGVHGGWGWGSEHVSTHSYINGVVTRSNETSIDTTGGLLGGQVGCDYQFFGNLVVGIQGDYAAARIIGDVQDPHDGANIRDVLRFQTDRIASVTARFGITGWGNQALLYARAGGAWLKNKYDFRDSDRIALRGIYDITYSGWTVGAGVEWAFAPSWSVFVEYNHYDFGNGTKTLAFRNFGGAFSEDYQVKAPTIDVVKFGVNYRFGWAGAVVAKD
jgi:outer membrane immunogenic protein